MDTLIEPNYKLGEALEHGAIDRGMYQWLVGRLIYLAHSRPNITYVVIIVNQFMYNLKDSRFNLSIISYTMLKELPVKGCSNKVWSYAWKPT